MRPCLILLTRCQVKFSPVYSVEIYLDALTFILENSTESRSEINQIKMLAKPLEFYNSPEAQKGMVVHPFLNFDAEDGQIHGHEGRHRAAAIIDAGGSTMPVALFPYPKHRMWKEEDLPSEF